MQRVDQDADLGPSRRLDQPHRRGQIRHHGPGEELQHGAQAVAGGQVGDGAEPVGEPGEVGVVGCGDDVLGAELGAGREERLQGARPRSPA